MPEGYFVMVRRTQKNDLLELFRKLPDKTEDEIVGLFSQQTGLKISTIKVYVDELKQAKMLEGI